MAGIFVILGPILGLVAKIGGYMMNPIKEELNNLCCYKGNTEKLRNEVEKQEIVRNTVQQAVDTAKRNVESIRPDVDDWLKRANNLKGISDKILNDRVESQKGCLSLWCYPMSYYSLSKEAKKRTEDCIALQVTAKMFERVSNPARIADLKMIPSVSQIGFKSRESVEKELMDALMDKSIHLIGLCGMGGVGKTMMVEHIVENLGAMFEEIVVAVVTQQPDLRNIQQEIAEGLGLKLEEKSLRVRARRLHSRLMEAKSALIILDDVWERLNLEELGVPSYNTHSGCKLILTSRVRNALTLTRDVKILTLEVLTDEEAWFLFREKAGDTVDAPELNQIAKHVAKECNGLPLALVTVGSALGGLSKPSWDDALLGLKRSIPTNIPELLKDVFKPLELSYNQLGNEEAHLFLLCCLFPEDYNICLETLVRYGLGLGIFLGTENLREARNRARKIVENLKNRFLLINSDKDGKERVRMHDMIRDMAISIALKDNHVFMINHNKELEDWPQKDSSQFYTCISLRVNKLKFLPERIIFPRLELLCMEFAKEQPLPENYFDGMRGLEVFDASGIQSVVSSLRILTNLRVLQLHNCSDLEKASIIGELLTLEILSLVDSSIKLLPKEIGELRNLKLLEIDGCSKLEKITPGVISRLIQLEELHILRSFKYWEVEEEGKERSNASLSEVASLSNLTTLKVEIPNQKHTLVEFPYWEKLRQYFIVIGHTSFSSYKENFQKVMWFIMQGASTPIGDWTYDMLRNAEYLKLEGHGSNDLLNKLARRGFQNIKDLEVSKCRNVKYLMPSHFDRHIGVMFPVVESLYLENCQTLKEFFQTPPPSGSFGALKQLKLQKLSGLTHLGANLCLSSLISVDINECESLQYAFSLATAESMRELEKLKIGNCPVMEEVFKGEGREGEITITEIKFPKLYELWLGQLPSLNGFCKGIDAFEFPSLFILKIEHLPKITNFCPTKSIFYQERKGSVCEQFLFNQEVICTGLKKLYLYKQNTATGIFKKRIPNGNFNAIEFLRIESCHELKSLFSPSSCSFLVNLDSLRVKDCSNLQVVIEREEEHQETNTSEIKFPRLRKLELLELQSIQAFCYPTAGLVLPSLELAKIINCPKMEIFFGGYLSVPNTILESNLANQPFFSKELACNSLKRLKLEGLNCTTGIFGDGIATGNFSMVELLEIESCHTLRSLFSPSMCGVLVNLKNMTVRNCSVMQQVIAEEEKIGQLEIKGTLFSSLKELVLVNLPKILCFNMVDIELPSLEQVTVEDCPLMEAFCFRSSNGQTSGSKLAGRPFFSKDVSSNSLKRLKLNKLNTGAEIFGHGIPIGSFSELEFLEIESCHNLRSIFSPPMFRGLTNLKYVRVKDCLTLQEIIAKEDNDGEMMTGGTIFPRLKKLKLSYLPNILGFCHLKGYIELPSLELLTVRYCCLMEAFSLPNSRATTRGPFFSKEVVCSSLKDLKLHNLNTDGIFGHGMPSRNFSGLELLEVGSCPNLTTLFLPPMFQGLKNLKVLKVIDCFILPEVVSGANEEGKTSKDTENMFPQLQTLKLVRLYELQRFGGVNNYAEVPSLKSVSFEDCPKLNSADSWMTRSPGLG